MQTLKSLILSIRNNQSNSGKQFAYTQVYNSARKTLIPFLKRRIKDDFDFEDVLSASLNKIILKLYTYDVNQSFEGWIKTVAKNTLVDFLRSGKKQNISIEDYAGQSTVNTFEFKDLSDYLYKRINSRPGHDRSVLIKRFFENKTCKEISEELKIPFGTVLTIIYRFRQSIKSMHHLAA